MTERKPVQSVSIQWEDIKTRVLSGAGDDKFWATQSFGLVLHKMAQDPLTKTFYCGENAPIDALKWIREGFYAPQFASVSSPLPNAIKRRACWSEEDGEVDVSRMMGGYDDVFYNVEKRERKPGIRIEFDLFFAASVPASVLNEYGEWLAGLIRTLESNGYDLSIAARAPVDAMTTKVRGRTHLMVEVKRTGELSDFREWSALFSPCGTRTLLFAGFGVASDKLGQRMTNHCATSVTDVGWGVEFDESSSTLKITADQRARSFPKETMTAGLKGAGIL